MLELLDSSPLGHRQNADGLAVGLREITDRGMIDLRGLGSDKKFLAAAKKALGFDLPKEVRTSSSWGDMKALWLSIDQWLILCPASKAEDVLARLHAELAGAYALAVDVSSMRTVMRIEGAGSREVLLKCCSLDLLGPDYPPGTVRRMRFAEIAALLHVVEQDAFDIYIFRSYAEYAWDFLNVVARQSAAISLFVRQSTPL
jgi:sarcosine oxidase, subunit gamma